MMRTRTGHAFTLVELLVVIGIIALLISILLPALNKARESANVVKCASNIRQLCMALTNYASENKGRFPPVITGGTNDYYSSGVEQVWYHQDRIGKYLPKTYVNTGSGSVGGPVMVCPNDEASARSYAINVWTASAGDQGFYNKTPERRNAINNGTGYVANPPFRGTFWGTGSKGSSTLILITEKYSASAGAEGLYYAGPTVGFQGDKPGQRFLGVPAMGLNMGRFGLTDTELDYSRHRERKDKTKPAARAAGRINIGFADSHVELLSHDELADPNTGKSRLRALWSPYDNTINN